MLAAGLTKAGMAVIIDKLLFCCFMLRWQGSYWWRFLQIKISLFSSCARLQRVLNRLGVY